MNCIQLHIDLGQSEGQRLLLYTYSYRTILNKLPKMEASNVDSDDDVIIIETEQVEIEVITLSDDENNSSSTYISTPKTPSLPAVNYIKREMNSAVIGTPTQLQYISPLQHFSENPYGSVFGVLQKVKTNSQKAKKRNRADKQIGKLVPKSESNKNSRKKSKNKNKALPNQPEVNNIQIDTQMACIQLLSDLSRSINLNLEPEDNDLRENSRDRSVDILNQLQASTRSDIEKTRSCNLNVEPPMTIEYNNADLQDDTSNQNVVIEAQAGLNSNMEKTGSLCNVTVEPPITMENSNVIQDNLSNQSMVNDSQDALSSTMEKTGSPCNVNVEPQITMEHNAVQDDLSNQSMVNEPQAGLSSAMEKTRSVCESNVESQATIEDNASNQYVVTMNEPKSRSNSTSAEPPAKPEYNDQEMNRDENPPAQQPATSNTFHVPQGRRSMQHQFINNSKFSRSENFDPLLSVIVQEGYPDVQYLSEYHLLIVRRLVSVEIDNVLAAGTLVPRFQDSYVKNGVILVKSANAESQTWLQSIVPTLNPDPGVNLIVLSLQELNQTYKIKICVYHDTSTQKTILSRIQKQNPDVNMRSWQLQSVTRLSGAKTAKFGSILHMSIPAYSVKLLENREFKLHYGLYQVDVVMKDAFYRKKR